MDRICIGILDKICSLSSLGRYTVISEEEFLESFPEGTEKDGAELKKALKILIAGGYVDLKYSDGELYCVSPLKKYEAPAEPEPLPPAEAPPETIAPAGPVNAAAKLIAVFFAAFAGGAAGSLIISLIFALV